MDDSRAASPAVWHFALNGESRGPVREDQIAGLIEIDMLGYDALVWRDGFDDWRPARDTELERHFREDQKTPLDTYRVAETPPAVDAQAVPIVVRPRRHWSLRLLSGLTGTLLGLVDVLQLVATIILFAFMGNLIIAADDAGPDAPASEVIEAAQEQTFNPIVELIFLLGS